MRLRCPICACDHELSAELIGDGRSVRCAQCRESWHALPAPAEAEPEPGPRSGGAPSLDIVTEARSERFPPRQHRAPPEPRPPRAQAQGRFGRFAAAAIVLISAGAGMAAIAQKEALVRAIPSSAALFQAIGLPVNLRGLAVSDLHGTLETLGGAPVLTLRGRIGNLRGQSNGVPPIRIALRDSAHHEVYSWITHAAKTRLDAGESLMFRSRLAAPPDGAQDIVVSFVGVSPEMGKESAQSAQADPATRQAMAVP